MTDEFVTMTADQLAKLKTRIWSPMLTESQQRLAKKIWDMIGEHLQEPTYEQWERGFMREMHPTKELILLLFVATAFSVAKIDFPDEDPGRLIARLVSVTLGNDGEPLLKQRLEEARQKCIAESEERISRRKK